MDKDVVPELLNEFNSDFEKALKRNEEYQQLNKSLDTYNQAFDLAEIAGNEAAEALNKQLTSDLMFDGTIPWNISDRVVDEVTGQLYEISNEAGMRAQAAINADPTVGRITGLQVQEAELDPDRVKGIKEMICSRTDIESVHAGVREALPGYSLNTVSSVMEENAKLQNNAGMTPKIVRKLAPGCCDWCVKMAGTYDYSPNMDSDVFRKHKNCRCTVDYYPGDGRVQNSHTKEWQNINKSGNTDIYKKSFKYSLDLQMFAQSDLKNQSTNSLKKGIRNLYKQISIHKDKINNPKKYYPEWDSFDSRYQQGLIKHWRKEINNFETSIKNHEEELKSR